MDKENKALNMNIDLDKLLFLGKQGVRRCYAFAGIVCNPLNLLEIKEIHPYENFKLNIGVSKNDNFGDIKDEFKLWVLRNSVREAIELFSITLDKIYEKFYINEKIKDFPKKPFPQKLEKENILLDKNLDNEFDEFFKALQSIRNAIAHHNSKVHIDNGISINIKELSIGIKTEYGEVKKVLANSGEPLVNDTDKLAQIFYEIQNVAKTFKKGEKINFTPEVLVKICWAVDISIEKLKIAMIKTLQTKGLSVTDYEGNEVILPN